MAGKGKNTHPGAPGVRPERLSFATLPHAVLLQAVVDAGILLSDARHSRGGRRESVTGPKRTGQKARDRAQARVEAITFLTDSGGDWADAREIWATAAGIDPDALRERAVDLLVKARAERLEKVRTRARPAHTPAVSLG